MNEIGTNRYFVIVLVFSIFIALILVVSLAIADSAVDNLSGLSKGFELGGLCLSTDTSLNLASTDGSEVTVLTDSKAGLYDNSIIDDT